MSIVVAEEHVFPLCEAPDHLPRRRGKKTHASTVFRWKDGIRGVALETVRIGGTFFTSKEALQRFFDRLSATDTPAKSVTSAANTKAVERAERELEAAGI